MKTETKSKPCTEAEDVAGELAEQTRTRKHAPIGKSPANKEPYAFRTLRPGAARRERTAADRERVKRDISEACGDDVFATTILDAIHTRTDGFRRLLSYTLLEVFDRSAMASFAEVTHRVLYTPEALVVWYRAEGLSELTDAMEKVFGADWREASTDSDDADSTEPEVALDDADAPATAVGAADPKVVVVDEVAEALAMLEGIELPVDEAPQGEMARFPDHTRSLLTNVLFDWSQDASVSLPTLARCVRIIHDNRVKAAAGGLNDEAIG